MVPQSEGSRSCRPWLWSGLGSLTVEQTVLNRWGGALAPLPARGDCRRLGEHSTGSKLT